MSNENQPVTNSKSLAGYAILTVICLVMTASLSHAAVVQSNDVAVNNLTLFESAISSTDLANQGQSSFGSLTSSPLTFGAGGQNNGSGGITTSESTFYTQSQHPFTLEFLLDTSSNSNGYSITHIQTIAGWAGSNATQAHQNYELLVRQVGSSTFSSVGTFINDPGFVTSFAGDYATRIRLSDNAGVIASNVEEVQFKYAYQGATTGPNRGHVIREIDIQGFATPTDQIAIASYAYDGTGAGASPTSWPDSGGELTNGLFPATSAFTDTQWVGFLDSPDNGGSHPQITFDLAGVHELDDVLITYLHSTTQAGGTITTPEDVRISTSVDGLSFSSPLIFTDFGGSANDEIRTALFDLSGLPDGRFVRLDFRNTSPWTFLGEVAFTGSLVPEPGTWSLLVITMVACIPLLRRRAVPRIKATGEAAH